MDYGFNGNINFGTHKVKMGEIDSPASKLLYAETCGAQTATFGDFNEVPCDPRVTSNAYITPRHLKGGENGSNICFGDGHVELVSEVEIPLLNEGMWLPTRR